MRANDTYFEGASAIVTGGASGIGRALGAQLVSYGAHVVLADIDGDAAEQAAAELASDSGPGSVVGRSLDVRDRASVRILVEAVCAQRGHVDLMFNNAGIALGGPTEVMSGVFWDRILEVNVGGVINGILAAYPVMVAQGRGHIVNTGSGAGLVSVPFAVAYSATKHAVVGLSTALRSEAASRGVRVSVLCPGMVETPILDKGPPTDLPPPGGSPLTGRAFLETAGMSPIRAELFARRALRGVARNRAIIVVPGQVRVGWHLARISPRLVDALGRVVARRVRRAMAITTAS